MTVFNTLPPLPFTTSLITTRRRHPLSSCPTATTTTMATVFRPPLAPRTTSHNSLAITQQHAVFKSHSLILKRPRSPEPHNSTAIHELAPIKRHRTQSALTKENVDKAQRRAEREARENDFRLKYTKAFPSWTFYFDTTDADRESLAARVLQLNGVRLDSLALRILLLTSGGVVSALPSSSRSRLHISSPTGPCLKIQT